MTRRSGRFAALLSWLLFATAAAAQSPPPVPTQYVTDTAGVLSADAVARLNARLKAFDDETSNQILVAVFPALPSASLEDFTVRTAQAWRAGRAKLDNGVVLFVFIKDHKVRLEVGYGLEGALPDITAHRIIEEQITPAFRNGDYAGGLEAAVTAIIAATRGEYKGEPQPAAGTDAGGGLSTWQIIFIVIVIILVIRSRGGFIGGGFPGGGTFGGGGFSGGGGFGGGGFSGGGGSFGGGGASGSW